MLLIPVGVLYFRLECGNLIRKKQDQVREQFVELLRFTVTSLRAGYSVENAFLDSYADLEKLYGERSVICKILRRFAIARQNHRPFAETWHGEDGAAKGAVFIDGIPAHGASNHDRNAFCHHGIYSMDFAGIFR